MKFSTFQKSKKYYIGIFINHVMKEGKMEKILTISIAAYNVEKYIRNTLESLIISKEKLNKLEIFVIDDGGTDGTLKIAQEYEKNYPGVFFAIHKEDDGYGSTVNYSLKHATGKYFKLLDGDDWFIKDNLENIIDLLEKEKSDVIIDDFYKCPQGCDSVYINAHNYADGDKIKANIFNPQIPVGMWAIIYRTEILKQVKLQLPENMFYVDQIYSTYPFSDVQEILFLKKPLYCYRVGQDGQSVSRASRVKYSKQMLECCSMLLDFSCKMKKIQNNNYDYILNRVSRYYQTALRTILLKEINKDNRKQLIKYEKQYKKKNEDVYKNCLKYGIMGKLIFLLRISNYSIYWLFRIFPIPNWK